MAAIACSLFSTSAIAAEDFSSLTADQLSQAFKQAQQDALSKRSEENIARQDALQREMLKRAKETAQQQSALNSASQQSR